jgi:hypothetical protein
MHLFEARMRSETYNAWRTEHIPYKRHLVQKTSRTEHLLLHAGKNAVVQETRLNLGPVELLHHMLNSGDQQSKDSRPSSSPLLGKRLKWKEEFDVLNNWGSHVLPLFVFPSITPWRLGQDFTAILVTIV